MFSIFQNSNKNILKFYISSKRFFKNYFGQGRSTGGRPCLLHARTADRTVDQSSGNWGCVRYARFRSTGPCCGRPTVSSQLSVCHRRPTGRSERANGHNFQKSGQPDGRPWVCCLGKNNLFFEINFKTCFDFKNVVCWIEGQFLPLSCW